MKRHEWFFYLFLTLIFSVHVTKAIFIFLVGQQPLFADDVGYCLIAKSIVETNGAAMFDTPALGPIHFELLRPLGYPILLASLFACFGKYGLVAAVIVNHTLMLAGLVLMMRVVGQVSPGKSAKIALLLVSLPAFYAISYANLLLCECLLAFLIAIFVALLVRWEQEPSLWGVAWIGLICGTMVIVKPAANGLILVALLIFCYRAPRVGWRTSLANACALLLVYCAFLAPHYIRNYANYGEPFLTKASDAAIFWCAYGDGPGAMDIPPPSKPPMDDLPAVGYRNWTLVLDQMIKKNDDPIAAYRLLGTSGRQAISNYPAKYLEVLPKRLWLTATTPGSPPLCTVSVESGYDLKTKSWGTPTGFAWFTAENYYHANDFQRCELVREQRQVILEYIGTLSQYSWDKFPRLLLLCTAVSLAALMFYAPTRFFGCTLLLTIVCMIATHGAVSPEEQCRYRACFELLQFASIATAVAIVAQRIRAFHPIHGAISQAPDSAQHADASHRTRAKNYGQLASTATRETTR